MKFIKGEAIIDPLNNPNLNNAYRKSVHSKKTNDISSKINSACAKYTGQNQENQVGIKEEKKDDNDEFNKFDNTFSTGKERSCTVQIPELKKFKTGADIEKSQFSNSPTDFNVSIPSLSSHPYLSQMAKQYGVNNVVQNVKQPQSNSNAYPGLSSDYPSKLVTKQ